MDWADPMDVRTDFWEASSLAGPTVAAFAAGLAAATPPAAGVHPFVGRSAVQPLRRVDDRLQRTLAARRSDRHFARRPLREREVARLLAAVGARPDGGRLVPAAGGFDALVAYAVGHRVDGPLRGRVARYDADAHGIADVGPAPGEAALRRLFLVDDGVDTPPLVVVFVIDHGATITKYGDRGVRFLLQQVGHAAQNVGLRLAADGLRGYVLGGGLDREVVDVLGLTATGAWFGGAVACGA
jgi:hypothetical protein